MPGPLRSDLALVDAGTFRYHPNGVWYVSMVHVSDWGSYTNICYGNAEGFPSKTTPSVPYAGMPVTKVRPAMS